MEPTATQTALPPAITTGDAEAANHKLQSFAKSGADNLHVILDFDRTITIGKHGEDDATTWQVLQRHLPAEGQARYTAFYEKYRAMELAGTMQQADARTWWSGILGLFVEYRVNLYEIEADFSDVIALRPGTRELFAACEQHDIPVVILSAGIKDVIELLLTAHGIGKFVTVSTELRLSDDGTIVGWEAASVVHVLNKHEAQHKELSRIRTERPHCIVVGDSLEDDKMAAGTDNVLRIRVVDPRPGEVMDAKIVRAETFARFDGMIQSGSLTPIVDLVRLLTHG